MTDPNEEIKMELKYLALICNNSPASQTVQEANKVARTHVYEEHIKEFDGKIEEDIFMNEESVFSLTLRRSILILEGSRTLKSTQLSFFRNLIKPFEIT